MYLYSVRDEIMIRNVDLAERLQRSRWMAERPELFTARSSRVSHLLDRLQRTMKTVRVLTLDRQPCLAPAEATQS
jgi:hypothetical protein